MDGRMSAMTSVSKAARKTSMLALHCFQGYTTAVRNAYFGLLLIAALFITSVHELRAQASSPAPTPVVGNFKTVDGKEYKNATVSRVEPDGLVLTTKFGISKVYFVELPKEVQERFHYDAAKGAEFASAEQAATAQFNAGAQAAALQRQQEARERQRQIASAIEQHQQQEAAEQRQAEEQQRQAAEQQRAEALVREQQADAERQRQAEIEARVQQATEIQFLRNRVNQNQAERGPEINRAEINRAEINRAEINRAEINRPETGP
jgi:hypothetical protein